VTGDENLIAYLEGEDVELDADARAEIEQLRATLGDEAIWGEPPADLEQQVVDAITLERATLGSLPPSAPVVASRRRRRPGVVLRWVGAATAAAAAVVLVVAFVAGRGTDREQLQAALAPTEEIPGVDGSATFTKFESGWQIELDAPDLPRLDEGRYYQAWLKNDEGTTVPVGTFNEGADVVLWAGVTPRDFQTITVTEEQADGNQDSSGVVVLAGPITE
jgi:hypothetical protein